MTCVSMTVSFKSANTFTSFWCFLFACITWSYFIPITNIHTFPTSPLLALYHRTPESSKIQYAVSTRWETEQENNETPKPSTLNICSSIFCCCSRRVGSMFFLCERKDGSPIMVAGPCWPFCLFITFPLVAGLSGLVLYFCMLREDSPLVSILKSPLNWVVIVVFLFWTFHIFQSLKIFLT